MRGEKMNTGGRDGLEVRMFGGFELWYKGQEYVIGRNSTVKYIQLLQLLWLSGTQGITKEQIINNLYDRESLADSNNSFSNLLYQMRRQMADAGLPKGLYIVKEHGCYIPDKAIPVHTDIDDFEQCIKQAERAPTREQAYQCYMEAFNLYRGELLPEISTELWVVVESARYKSQFNQCVRWLGEYLKEQREYERMCRVYSAAAEIYPYDEWQIHQIDGLLHRGEYKEAYQLYDRTTKRYSEELGLGPSENLVKCFQDMNWWIKNEPNRLADIKKEMDELAELRTKERRHPGYCSYLDFVNAYCMLRRSALWKNTSAALVLCTLVDYEGKTIQNQEKLKERSEGLKRAIGESICQEDIYARYSSSQYLILFWGKQQERREAVLVQIKNQLKKLTGSRTEVICNMVPLGFDFEIRKEEVSM